MGLSKAVEQGREAWPDLDVDAADFERWLGDRAQEDGLDFASLWLARACLVGAPGAVRTFQDQVLKAALKGIPASDRDDLAQWALEKLLAGSRPGLAQYRGDGSLLSWLKTTLTREHRARASRPQAERLTGRVAPLAAAVTDRPDLAYERQDSKRRLKSALAAALADEAPEDQELLAAHYLDGVPHGELGEKFGIPRSTIAHRLTRLRERLLASTKKHLKHEGANTGDVESLIDIAKQSLQISIANLRKPKT